MSVHGKRDHGVERLGENGGGLVYAGSGVTLPPFKSSGPVRCSVDCTLPHRFCKA